MTNPGKKLLSVAASAILITCCTSCYRNQQTHLKPGQAGRGYEWLTWTSAERSRYVYGYLDGYGRGYLEACQDADDQRLFKEKVPPYPGDENVVNKPVVHCRSRRKNYSKEKLTEKYELEIGPYPEILTELFEKHPDTRSVPYSLLLELLSDGQAINAEELYKAQLGKWPNAKN